jgi:acetolactate synthase-1/2/3 large subunit
LKIKASDYLLQLLKEFGIETVFCVTGGAAAHLMESVRASGIECVHHSHEQACAMAADAYARIKKKPAVVLVTNGPGSSNTITGVLGAYQDSIPMIVISGQVPRRQTIAKSGKHLRQFGEQEAEIIGNVQSRQTIAKSGKRLRQFGVQEAEIIGIVHSMTKFAVQITSANQLRDQVVKACHEATSGRMGPVWLDIPLDVQAELLDSESLLPYEHEDGHSDVDSVVDYRFDDVAKAINMAQRPLVVAGAGIHLSDCEHEFKKLILSLKIPVVCTWSATDLFDYEDELYVGNFGLLGERAANLAIQNADLLIVLGSRMSIPNVGYATELFSPKSKKIMVDIDRDEIEKNSLSIDVPIIADVRKFVIGFTDYAAQINKASFQKWGDTLNVWKKRFVVFAEPHHRVEGRVNSYDFIGLLSKKLARNDVVVTDMGTSFTCTMQSLRNNGSNRLMTSSACCSMGFGLPGAIGAYYANKENRIICIAGDGGFQMNIQELQTVFHNRIPLKIFVLNSNGYLAISLMQDNLFDGKHFGSTPDSGVSAPNFARVAEAYGIPARKIESLQDLESGVMDEILLSEGPFLCEIMIPSDQLMIPRVQSKRDSEGRIVSGSIDSMFPYLPASAIQQIEEELNQV